MSRVAEYSSLGGHLSAADFVSMSEVFQLQLLSNLRIKKDAQGTLSDPPMKVTKDSHLPEKIAFAKYTFDKKVEKIWEEFYRVLKKIMNSKEEICAVKFQDISCDIPGQELRHFIRKSSFRRCVINMADFNGHLIIALDLEKLSDVRDRFEYRKEKDSFLALYSDYKGTLEEYCIAAENSLANCCLLPYHLSFEFAVYFFVKKCLKAAHFECDLSKRFGLISKQFAVLKW